MNRTKAEAGLGTVRTVRDRQGVITGYQPLLPRSLSTAPKDCASSKAYKEPVGTPVPTWNEARRILDAAIVALRRGSVVRQGLPLSHFVDAEIQKRLHDARRKYATLAKANRLVSTWRSIDRLWLSGASFYAAPPKAIEPEDVQSFFDYLRDEAEGKTGEPLSGDFIRNVARLLKAAFARVPGLTVNPAGDLDLPPKGVPLVPFLDLAAQRRFFGSDVALVERVMVGCGMGAGLRVGELLPFEAADVHLDASDPHLIIRYGGSDHAPTKGGRVRRVELFEPGLGFWRLWMERFYQGGVVVFPGPLGGYQKHWPERFPSWAATAGVKRLSSHIMRHSYAVAMLSGSWGYEPKGLEFVQHQLGHAERSTTERYYGAFEAGVWSREVRHMTGRVEQIRREPVTAIELLGLVSGGLAGAASGAAGGGIEQKSPRFALAGVNPRRSPKTQETAEETARLGAATHQARVDRIDAVLAVAAAGEPTALRQAVECLQEERELHQRHVDLATLPDDDEADVG